MRNNIDLKDFIQIAIIVPDVEKAAREWSELLNVPMPEIIEQKKPDGPIPYLTYRGHETSYGLRLAVIQAPQGFIIELHECCDDGDSTFNEFVRKHGYGVHHLGFKVGERRDAVVGELEERGYAIRTFQKYGDNSWTIVDTEDALGINLNIKPKLF